jgi:hypothetical protein
MCSHSLEEEPQSYKDAIRSKNRREWKRAMKEEMDSLEQNKTWSQVEPATGRKIIQNRWVFKIKKDRDGNQRFKARLIAKGYTRRRGINYTETYAFVVKYNTLGILAIAASRKCKRR